MINQHAIVTSNHQKVILNCGDWFERYNELTENSIDLVLTDPPYGIFKGKEVDRPIDLKLFNKTLFDVLKQNGLAIIFCNLNLMSELRVELTDFDMRSWHIWHKSMAQPISNYQPLPNAEFILVFKKLGVRTSDTTWHPRKKMPKQSPYEKRSNQLHSPTRRHIKSQISENKDGSRWIPNTIIAPPKCHLPLSERTNHVFQKPEYLLRIIIGTYSNPSDIVLDCFGGSGSTVLSALKEGRSAIYFELLTKYYNLIKKRVLEYIELEKQITLDLHINTNIEQQSIFKEK